MKISVILPCHNAASYVADALGSIARQTLVAHEVIVVDDASSDDSIDQIRASVVPTKILRIQASNAAAARNAALREVTTGWVAFLDADDVWFPQHLEAATAILRGSDDVAYMAHYDLLTLDGRRLPLGRAIMDRAERGIHSSVYLDLFSRGMPHSSGTYVLRTDRMRMVGGFDETQIRRHDIDLWLRVIATGTWSYSPVPAMGYRTSRPDSISKHVPERNYYMLRTLARNERLYAGPVMRRLLHDAAVRAIRTACTQGGPGDRSRAKHLGWTHLTSWERAMWSVALRFPSLLHGARRVGGRKPTRD